MVIARIFLQEIKSSLELLKKECKLVPYNALFLKMLLMSVDFRFPLCDNLWSKPHSKQDGF